jgi:hypothetical protein
VSHSTPITEQLLVVAEGPAVISPLSQTPLTKVDFFVNGIHVTPLQFSNTGTAVTATESLLGYQLSANDVILAEYGY